MAIEFPIYEMWDFPAMFDDRGIFSIQWPPTTTTFMVNSGFSVMEEPVLLDLC